MGTELLPSCVLGKDAALANGTRGSPVSHQHHPPACLSLSLMRLGHGTGPAGKAKLERAQCNEELTSLLGQK